jgi:hypothetical protein
MICLGVILRAASYSKHGSREDEAYRLFQKLVPEIDNVIVEMGMHGDHQVHYFVDAVSGSHAYIHVPHAYYHAYSSQERLAPLVRRT